MNAFYNYGKTRTVLILAAVLSISLGSAFAEEEDRGPILIMGFSGSSNDPVWVYKLDTTAGYKFNNHVEIDFGLPVYFVHVPSDNVDGYTSQNGIGNAYFDLTAMFSGSNFYFATGIRGTAPTGDEDTGFSTGRVTADWTNYFDLSLGRWNPFGSVGIANTVSDTHFFSRPFTSLGLVGHVEGGLTYAVTQWSSIGGSAYAVLPTGEQKIYSKLVPGRGDGSDNTSGPDTGNGPNRGGRTMDQSNADSRVFETGSYVAGESDIAKDHGFSGWIDVFPSSFTTFEFGYSRSVSYDYNSIFFSVQFDFGQLLRK